MEYLGRTYTVLKMLHDFSEIQVSLESFIPSVTPPIAQRGGKNWSQVGSRKVRAHEVPSRMGMGAGIELCHTCHLEPQGSSRTEARPRPHGAVMPLCPSPTFQNSQNPAPRKSCGEEKQASPLQAPPQPLSPRYSPKPLPYPSHLSPSQPPPPFSPPPSLHSLLPPPAQSLPTPTPAQPPLCPHLQ